MRKFGKTAAVFCVCMLLLAGCGGATVPDTVDTTSVLVSADGQITVWLVGDFGSADYNLSELTTQAVNEVSEFNAANGIADGISVERVEAVQDNGGKVAVIYHFDGWENCTKFIGNRLFYGTNELFYGTVGEAVEKGYGSNVIMKNVKDGTLLSEQQLKQETDKKLIVTDIKANIYYPGTVSCISDGASVNEDGSIDSSGAEGLVYILLK